MLYKNYLLLCVCVCVCVLVCRCTRHPIKPPKMGEKTSFSCVKYVFFGFNVFIWVSVLPSPKLMLSKLANIVTLIIFFQLKSVCHHMIKTHKQHEKWAQMLRWAAPVQVSLPGGSLTNFFCRLTFSTTNVLESIHVVVELMLNVLRCHLTY